MDECYKAIQLDPEFGNPYNDLGSYFLSLKMPALATKFLEKAKTCNRYEVRQFPCINLCQHYLSKREYPKAIKEWCAALLVAPWEEPTADALKFLPTWNKECELFMQFVREPEQH